MRMIDADLLIEKADIEGEAIEGTIGDLFPTLVKWLVEKIPTVEERTGHWILHENQRQEDVDNGNYLYICSECGKSDLHAKTQEVPFCWWCGAHMKGGETE